jgi:hypothetical protein
LWQDDHDHHPEETGNQNIGTQDFTVFLKELFPVCHSKKPSNQLFPVGRSAV